MEKASHCLRVKSRFTDETESIVSEIIDAAYKVHYELGPGLLESVYEECLCLVLEQKGIEFERQFEVPIEFSGKTLKSKLRIDLFVAGVVTEVKSVEKMQPLHLAQLMTYMKLTKAKIGLLINFNVPRIKEGIRRIVL